MKLGYILALPMLFACCYGSAVHAEDVIVKDHHGVRNEYRMHVTRHGDRFVGVYNNHEYVLRGDAVTHINADGDYVVYGNIGPDNTYIETSELQLAPAQPREVIVERERPVIVERERDPFIKVGPLEIGH